MVGLVNRSECANTATFSYQTLRPERPFSYDSHILEVAAQIHPWMGRRKDLWGTRNVERWMKVFRPITWSHEIDAENKQLRFMNFRFRLVVYTPLQPAS